jgi:hypothetical protein
MQRSASVRRRTRSALAIALAGTAGGAPACRSWRAEPLPRVAGGAAAPAPERVVRGPVRVTRLDGRRAELAVARVADDTVRGPLRGRSAGGAATVAVPLDSVAALHTRRFSPLRTAGLAAGILAVWVALAFAALSAVPVY